MRIEAADMAGITNLLTEVKKGIVNQRNHIQLDLGVIVAQKTNVRYTEKEEQNKYEVRHYSS